MYKHNHKCSFTAMVLMAFMAVSIGISSPVRANEAIKVMVSIVPQKYFVKKIGGRLIDVSVMVLPGSSPAIYEPKPQQMVELSKTKIYFAIGVPFEMVWLGKFGKVNPGMTVVRTQDGVQKISMASPHRHHKEVDHQEIKDPHIWLSPPLVMTLARNILGALVAVDPEHRVAYETNFKSFMVEAADLDMRIKDVFSGNGERTQFMAYHPSWGYFAETYGLEQIPIEIEGKEPKARELERLIQMGREESIKAIFVQPQFSVKGAHAIAKAIGCRVLFADPLAEDWRENLLGVADQFRAVLE